MSDPAEPLSGGWPLVRCSVHGQPTSEHTCEWSQPIPAVTPDDEATIRTWVEWSLNGVDRDNPPDHPTHAHATPGLLASLLVEIDRLRALDAARQSAPADPWLADIVHCGEASLARWQEAHRNEETLALTFVGPDGPFYEGIRSVVERLRDYHLRAAGVHVERTAPLDVDLLREAGRRSGLPRDVSVGDIEDLASEYGRLLAERDRLVGEGVDPADLLVPDAPHPDPEP